MHTLTPLNLVLHGKVWRTYLQLNEDVDFKDADARLVVGEKFSSGAGASMVHEDLQAKGLLKQSPGQGGSCAN